MRRELVERDAELTALSRLVHRAASGQGGAILVEGPAGIGKSSLLETVEVSGAGPRVLRARGGELEREFAFGLVRQLFERSLHDSAERDRRAWLAGPAVPAAALLGVAAPLDIEEGVALHALYWLVVQMSAERPLVLVLDDLHWADEGSLRFAVYLARRLEGLPVALVAAARPADPQGATELLAVFRHEKSVSLLRLDPLTVSGTMQLVEDRLGDADDVFGEACHAASGGNPLLVNELLAEMDAEGLAPNAAGAARVAALVSAGLQGSVAARIHAVGPDAEPVARAVALLGDDVAVAEVAQLAGLDASTTARVAELLAGTDILRAGVPLAMAHPLVRAAVLAELGPAAAAQEHLRAARLLHGRGAEPERVVAQLESCDPVREPWAVDAFIEAAGKARSRGAPDVAARLFERGLAEEPDDDARVVLLTGAGSALLTSGEIRGASLLLEARDMISDPRRRAALLLQATAVPGWFIERPEAAVEVMEAATEEARREAPGWVVPLLVERASRAALGSGEDPVALRAAALAEVARLDAESLSARVAIALLAVLGAGGGQSADEVVAMARRALGDARMHREAIDAGQPMVMAIAALALCDETEGIDEAFDRVEEGARRRGALSVGLALCLGMRGFVQLRRGRLAEAESDGRMSLEIGSAFQLGHTMSQAAVSGARLERGDVEAALEILAVPQPFVAGVPAAVRHAARARALLRLRRPDDALSEAMTGREAAQRAGCDVPVWMSWRTPAAEALIQLGRGGEAEPLAREELSMATQLGSPGVLG